MKILTLVIMFFPVLLSAENYLQQAKQPKHFQVIEFRRYTVKEAQRQEFAQYFDTYFPEAFQQLGAMAFGEFTERDNPEGFTWIRGFQDIESRATINSAFYYGPVWKEHAMRMNDRMIDSDNVLLLHPLSPEHELTILPAVDPVHEKDGSKGIVAAQIFKIDKTHVDEFVQQAEPIFDSYRNAGIREAGILITLDVKNNFPQLPFREDGPYLVWIGILKDNDMLQLQFQPLVKNSLQALTTKHFLKSEPELIILEPTSRSRLRWISQDEKTNQSGTK
jgi:NIPSNAP protein